MAARSRFESETHRKRRDSNRRGQSSRHNDEWTPIRSEEPLLHRALVRRDSRYRLTPTFSIRHRSTGPNAASACLVFSRDLDVFYDSSAQGSTKYRKHSHWSRPSSSTERTRLRRLRPGPLSFPYSSKSTVLGTRDSVSAPCVQRKKRTLDTRRYVVSLTLD